MKNSPLRSPSRSLTALLPKLLFLFSIILSIITTYYVSGHFLDSDASSELVLAKHLSETGQIVSRDWIYSTELRVLNTQLVYAPMFLLFQDWQLVRFCSALVLQAIYILSYGFMLQQSGFSKNSFYMSASLLLLPVSVTYGRILLYHCYYIPHIAISFLLVGLFLGFAKGTTLSPVKGCIRLGIMMFLSLLGGLNGIRQLMVTHVPMLLLILLVCMAEDFHGNETDKPAILSRQKLILLAVAGLALLASFVGYKINTNILPKYFTFDSYSDTTLAILDSSELPELLYGFLHQFGFRKFVPLLSLPGILSVGGIFSAGYCLYLAVKAIRSHSTESDLRKTIVYAFFLCYTTVMAIVFLITSSPSFFALYYVLSLSWAAPLLLSIPVHIPRNLHFLHFKRILSWGAVLLLFLNGLANTAFFNGSEKFEQPYEGLVYQEKNTVAQISGLVDYLSENDYDAGYATFWECNIITELTDGQIPMSHIIGSFDENHRLLLSYCNWLTSQWQREAPKEKPFVVLNANALGHLENSDYAQYCTPIYSDAFYCALRIDDLDGFLSELAPAMQVGWNMAA